MQRVDPSVQDNNDGSKNEDTHTAWEAECVEATRRGEVQSFNRLVETYTPRIYAHLFRLVRNREEAEDLTQETFIRAYRYLGQYDQTRPFQNWLYTLATNLGLNALRAKKRRLATTEKSQDSGSRRTQNRSVRAVIQGELRERLDRATQQLPEKSAILIHLHYQEGLAIREAAGIVGMSEGAAKVALHRARKMLRQSLSEDESHDML